MSNISYSEKPVAQKYYHTKVYFQFIVFDWTFHFTRPNLTSVHPQQISCRVYPHAGGPSVEAMRLLQRDNSEVGEIAGGRNERSGWAGREERCMRETVSE